MNKQAKLEDWDFFDPKVIVDPFEFYEKAQQEAPVYKLPGTNIYLVTQFDDVMGVIKNWQVFSNEFGGLMNRESPSPRVVEAMSKGYPPVETMLTADPPKQKRYRSLVNKAFSQKRVKELHGSMDTIVEDLIAGFIDKDVTNIMEDFCIPLPVWVIADALGAPREDFQKFKEWSDAFIDQFSMMVDEDRMVEACELIVEFQHYFVEKIEERRKNPGTDIVSDLITARIEGEQPLDIPEMLSIIQQVMVAGNETTTSTLAGGILHLIQNPEYQEKLRGNPELIEKFVEEVLRLETPTAGMWRMVKEDSEIHGVKIPKGSALMIRFAAANRDPQKFENPHQMNPERPNVKDHMAFGQGIHFCLGALLARQELTIGFTRFLDAVENVQLAPGYEQLNYVPNILLRGLKDLHITFDKR